MSGHTPGPWEVGGHDDGVPGYVYCDNEFGSAVAIAYGDALAYTCLPRDEQEANARLIAAAPDLLAALVEMRDLFDLMCGLGFSPADGHEGSPKANADAAIAKATGAQA